MTIDWAAFTPWSALAGGGLIGAAAALLALSLGRIAGVSGIVGALLHREATGAAWRTAFIVGLVLAAPLFGLFHPEAGCAASFAVDTPGGWAMIAVGGVLVGFGTRLGSGCTSGHGVCGLARLSRRSAVAVLTFMSSGMATVFVVRHFAWG